jgi:hypothetical protein
MLKGKRGLVMFALGVAAWVCACGSGSNPGTPSNGGTTGGAGGASGSPDGSAGAGGATSTGGTPGADGAAGMPITTLAEACAKNCSVASGLQGCSTTEAVCEQSCLTTFDNTSAINADLGRQYTEMMICVANNPQFGSPDGFVCAKPDRALNKWSPGPGSDCEQLICDWNCNDGTTGNFDPFVDIRCMCSSL